MFEVLNFIALGVALLFCAVRTVVDLRARKYWWAMAACVSTVGIATAPFPKQTINIRLDAPSGKAE